MKYEINVNSDFSKNMVEDYIKTLILSFYMIKSGDYKMTEGLLEEYRYILHENKNQLLIIKSMIKDNYELEEYLNHLINFLHLYYIHLYIY